MSLGSFFERKRLWRFSSVRNASDAKEAIKARVIDVKITRVFNYRYPITKKIQTRYL